MVRLAAAATAVHAYIRTVPPLSYHAIQLHEAGWGVRRFIVSGVTRTAVVLLLSGFESVALDLNSGDCCININIRHPTCE